MSKKIKIVLDTDMGTDDAWTLIAILRSEEKYNMELKAITIVPGNTEAHHAAQNTLLILDTMKRTDIKVYFGAKDSLLSKTINTEKFHGEDGFKDVIKSCEKPSLNLMQSEHAIEVLKNLILENPHEITIFAIGPLTNIALLLKMYPDVADKIHAIHVMGGNFQGVGNTTRCAEFNFWFDPEAAFIVLKLNKCPLYIMPWETCLNAKILHQGWRFGVLNTVPSDFMTLMDKLEENVHYRGNFVPCDILLIACFCLPKIIKVSKEHHVSVELTGEETRGQMILDHMKNKKPNAFVIEEVDVELLKQFLCRICGHSINDF